jgi:hypothetical protein
MRDLCAQLTFEFFGMFPQRSQQKPKILHIELPSQGFECHFQLMPGKKQWTPRVLDGSGSKGARAHAAMGSGLNRMDHGSSASTNREQKSPSSSSSSSSCSVSLQDEDYRPKYLWFDSDGTALYSDVGHTEHVVELNIKGPDKYGEDTELIRCVCKCTNACLLLMIDY